MVTIASVSVAVTWDGDDDQGLLENGPFLLDHGGELDFREIAAYENGDTARMSYRRHTGWSGVAVQARAAFTVARSLRRLASLASR